MIDLHRVQRGENLGEPVWSNDFKRAAVGDFGFEFVELRARFWREVVHDIAARWPGGNMARISMIFLSGTMSDKGSSR